MVGRLTITREKYDLTIKKVDTTNPNKGLAGAKFLVQSNNGTYSKEVVTGRDGTVIVGPLEAGTYSITELEPPEGYEIDNAGPQYVALPNGGSNTVTISHCQAQDATIPARYRQPISEMARRTPMRKRRLTDFWKLINPRMPK